MIAMIRVLSRLIRNRSLTSGRPMAPRPRSRRIRDLIVAITLAPSLCYGHPFWVPGRCRGPQSGCPVFIPDAIQRFDIVEFLVLRPDLATKPLDVAVDRAVIKKDGLTIGGVHQLIPVLHHAGARGQRLEADILKSFILSLEIPDDAKERLMSLTPDTYLGYAADLAKKTAL